MSWFTSGLRWRMECSERKNNMATFNEMLAKEEARKAYKGYDELSVAARTAFERGFLAACEKAKEGLIETGK